MLHRKESILFLYTYNHVIMTFFSLVGTHFGMENMWRKSNNFRMKSRKSNIKASQALEIAFKYFI